VTLPKVMVMSLTAAIRTSHCGMKRKTAVTFALILITIVIVVRIGLPPFVAWYVNRTHDRISGYDASIDSLEGHIASLVSKCAS
jgi:hypothetical protein